MSDRLYTPWRLNYIQNDRTKPDRCVFCAKITGDDETELVVARGDYIFVTLNIYPYNNGHVMVIPNAHVDTIEALPPAALTELMTMTNSTIAALRAIYKPDGFNIGANVGAAAGAGIAAHFHLHIVPRWGGDTNFMGVTADTRIIPDPLIETWRKLRAAWL